MGCRAPGPTTGVRHRLRPREDFALSLEPHDQELVALLDLATGMSLPAFDRGASRCPPEPLRPARRGPVREEQERKGAASSAYGVTMTHKTREPTISLRLPPGKLATLDANARAAGKTRNAYLVEAAVGSSNSRVRPIPTVQKRMLGLILARAAKVKALVMALLEEADDPLVRDCLQLLDDIGACAQIGLGKDP